MYKLSVIGVGNMAKAIIGGVVNAKNDISAITLFDKIESQYKSLEALKYDFLYSDNIAKAIEDADLVLLAVKPQSYDDVLSEIGCCDGYSNKTYISIAAGITAGEVSSKLGDANVIRVLPNLPMVIGRGVSLICKNDKVEKAVFDCVTSLFASSGSVRIIDESEMNRLISVTSSSPAYVFEFIDSIYKGALAQGLDGEGLLPVICDVIIGSAMLLKASSDTPAELVSKVSSKGGTTEQAIKTLKEFDFEGIIGKAMMACTVRADELGRKKQ